MARSYEERRQEILTGLRDRLGHIDPEELAAALPGGFIDQAGAANRDTQGLLRQLSTVEKIIEDVAATRITERGATRGDDKVSEAAMEDRKKEGYF
jgi:3'-phosphoadenosine 5'-phosphosulfate sulfotransferase (PAPS reductase)/FAD synthetase